MRTGAIFARGSCRALKWMALLGMVFTMGASQAAAQPEVTATGAAEFVGAVITVSVTETGSTVAHRVTGTPNASDFEIGGTAAQSATVSGSEITVTFASAATVTVGASLEYTQPADTRKQITSVATGVALANFTTALAEKNTVPQFTEAGPAHEVELNEAISTPLALPRASGGNGALTYEIAETLPAGLTFNATPASDTVGPTIDGTPTALTNGAESFTLTVTDTATAAPEGPETSSLQFTITVYDEPVAPAMPTVMPTPNVGGSLTVTWTMPVDNNSEIFDYEVQHREMGATRWQMHTEDLGAESTSTTISGLTVGTEYEFQVRARNAAGWSGWSATGTGTPLDVPLSVTVRPDPPSIPEGGTSKIIATANRDIRAEDGTVTVDLIVVPEDGAELDGSSITIATGTDSNFVTLTAAEDDTYDDETVTVVASGTGIDGDQHVTITVTDPAGPMAPSAPRSLSARAGDGQVTLSWEAPASGDAPTGYEFRSAVDDRWSDWADTSSMTGHTVTGLTNGAEYMFDVRAVAGQLAGEAARVTATPMAALMPPAEPTGLAARAGDGQVTLSWTAPTSGGAPSGYQYRVIGGGVTGAWADTSSMTGQLVTNLANGTEYTFEVRAFNAAGQGAAASTMATPMAAPASIPRGQITAMKITRGSSGSSSTEVLPQIMVGGANRYHVQEGWNDVWLAVTARWTHKEIDEIGNLPPSDRTQWVHVEIKHDRLGRPLPIPGVNWVSWIDDEGDADFPQTQTAGRLSGRLQAWVPFTPPSVRPDDYPGSERHHKDRTSYIRVLLPVDQHEAENDAFFIEATSGDVDLGATAAVNLTTPIVIIEDMTPQKVSVSRKRGEPSVIYEGAPSPESSTVAGQALYTVTASPARVDLPLEVRMDLVHPEGAVRAGDVSLSHSVVTLNPASDSRQDMYLSLPYPDGDRVDDKYTLQASVVQYSLRSGGEENTVTPSSTEVMVYDRHKLPWLTVSPVSGVVTEGDEKGIELTLTVNRNPANTIAENLEVRQYTPEALTIAVDASGSSNFTMTPSSISVEKHNGRAPWVQTAKVKITAAADEDIDAETLMLNFAVNGTDSNNGPSRPSAEDENSMAEATLTIQDGTATLVKARENAYDVIKGALGDPPMLYTGKSGELMGGNLFDYDSSAVSVAYATSVEGGAVTASASGGTITLMGAMAGDAKVTITATATPTASSLEVNQTKANVAQMTFPVMVKDEDLVFMVAGPDDMNLTEGGMGGMVTVTTNRPVTENTEVMLMRDGSSTASDDDYTLEPPLITIMAGHKMGSTMVMATEDGTAEQQEMLTLFLVVDGMQMTDKSVSFYIWDAAVPALPVIAQLLLAALMALGGYRRYRRR